MLSSFFLSEAVSILQLVHICNRSGYPENLSLSGEAMEIMDPETGAMQIISKPQGQAGCKEWKTIENLR